MSNETPADLVLTGTRVYTVNDAAPWAEAVAIRGGRIAAVGSDADVRALVGPCTDVLELAGRMVVPGFQDAHVHPPFAGLVRSRCDLHATTDREEYRGIIRGYAESHPQAAWILGGGWFIDAFPGGTPGRQELDEIVPDRPVYLPNRDGHGAWVNSRALELAGITRETPDPPDGRIERTADGEPSGTLHEGAMSLVEKLVPETSQEEWERGILAAQAYLHSLGITAWQDAIVEPDTFAAYVALAQRHELTARVVGALWWERDRGDEQVEELIERRRRGRVGRFAATSVKIMQDGILENFTGALLEPYLDADGRPTNNRGISFVEPEALKAYVARLDREGFQVHFHAIGERAVREALDAFEAARSANGRNDLRHHISHIQVIHPDDRPRFAELDVVANGQPLWACNESQMVRLTIPFLGRERSSWQYPFASLLRTGATLAFGSDWSVSSPDPLDEIDVAVNRLPPNDRGAEPFYPQERIGLDDALRAFTMGSAYVNHLDDETGSIEQGKLADLAVIDRDLFAPDAGPIADARVVLTLVEGRAVHRSEPLGS